MQRVAGVGVVRRGAELPVVRSLTTFVKACAAGEATVVTRDSPDCDVIPRTEYDCKPVTAAAVRRSPHRLRARCTRCGAGWYA